MRRVLAGTAAVLFWLAVWQFVSVLVGQELLVPAPLVVLDTLAVLAQTPEFWLVTGTSLLRIGIGFVLGVVVGCAAAVLTSSYRVVDALLSPALRVVRAAPVASFIILALVWIPTGRLPAVIALLMVVPVFWDTMTQGLRAQDRQLLEMAAVFRLGWWPTLLRVRIPSLVPFFTAACTTGMGLAWKSGVAAEVISRSPLSIGGRLQDAKVYLETPGVFAWTITAVSLSMALERLLRAASARGNRRVRVPAAQRNADAGV